MFNSASEAIFWIENIRNSNKKTGLNRMKRALKLLGNPHLEYKKVHVAGTNGKGSTVSYLNHLLREMGQTVGIFVSPYVICFNERIQVNNEFISDEELLELANQVYLVSKQLFLADKEVLSFFEIITLIGFQYFKNKKVDYAVIEVGLGGLLDATNVIYPEVSVITNIGFDHMDILGNDIHSIAINKLGIVKQNGVLFSTVERSLWPLFEEYTREKNVIFNKIDIRKITVSLEEKTKFVLNNEKFETPLLGIHQAYNAVLAILVVQYLFPLISSKQIQSGLEKTSWPGRLEKIRSDKNVYLDGAHNIDGIEALVDSIKIMKKNNQVFVIFSALKGKEIEKMLEEISSVADEVYLTEIEDPRCQRAIDLLEVCQHQNKKIISFEQILSFIDSLSDKELCIITGSLHFISQIRKKLL